VRPGTPRGGQRLPLEGRFQPEGRITFRRGPARSARRGGRRARRPPGSSASARAAPISGPLAATCAHTSCTATSVGLPPMWPLPGRPLWLSDHPVRPAPGRSPLWRSGSPQLSPGCQPRFDARWACRIPPRLRTDTPGIATAARQEPPLQCSRTQKRRVPSRSSTRTMSTVAGSRADPRASRSGHTRSPWHRRPPGPSALPRARGRYRTSPVWRVSGSEHGWASRPREAVAAPRGQRAGSHFGATGPLA